MKFIADLLLKYVYIPYQIFVFDIYMLWCDVKKYFKKSKNK